MPTRPPSPCPAPGCAALVAGGGYCTEHAQAARRSRDDWYDRTRRVSHAGLAQAKAVRDSARWKRISRQFRAQFPICADPFNVGCAGLAERVNHIESLQLRPDLAWTDANHAPLCTACDARIGALERQGIPTPPLFVGWRIKWKERHQRGTGGESESIQAARATPNGCVKPKRAKNLNPPYPSTSNI
jgi:5-methylcytosine-specific restriction endonuclease McrA